MAVKSDTPMVTLRLTLTLRLVSRETPSEEDADNGIQSAEEYWRALEIFRDRQSPYREDTQST